MITSSDASVVGIFGAGLPTEDHALQACRAALAVKAAVQNAGDSQLRLCIGLDSGETVLRPAPTGDAVRIETQGAVVRTGEVWIAPGNFHMTLARQGCELVLKLNQNAPVNSCRPSVDVLFNSVAEVIGAASLGVVLTGMGRDGRDGSAAMKASLALRASSTDAIDAL